MCHRSRSRGSSVAMTPSRLTRWARRGLAQSPPVGAGPATGPSRHDDNPSGPEVLSDFSFFAVIKSWMDEDVIEATVRNAQIQGAEAVYLVDNGSTDATVAVAEAAGATVAESYQTEAFDGRLAQALMNAVVVRESLRSRNAHIWWLYLDSDEFPEGPDGLSIRDYLATLDRRFRIVGSAYVNHVPDSKPEYLPGYHPIDFQPLCYEFEPVRQPPCVLGHWKHPLQRFDRAGHFILSSPGTHTAICADELVEPSKGIFTHHFQYREEELTRSKLELTCGPEAERTRLYASRGHGGFARRLRSLDAVYASQWDEVDTVPSRNPNAVRHPTPWADLATVRRWYSMGEVEEARSRWVGAAPGPAEAR
jgi:glycosyltransferase involved in cell wall biosynthesis